MTVQAELIGSRYRLLDKLGQGGMGSVHRALDCLTGQHVALKQVEIAINDLAFTTRQSNPSLDPYMALANEFQSLATLRHPNIIRVLDYGFDSRRTPYFTMTLLDDPDDIVAAAQTRPLSDKIKLIMQMMQSLAYIHRRGLLHRDLKPTNVLVTGGHVNLVDFGLALAADDRSEIAQTHVAGTLPYLAPEVLTVEQHTVLSDLYAAGLICYEILTGVYPFESDSITEMIGMILTHPVDFDRLNGTGIFEEIIPRLISRDPLDRYSSADDVIEQLREAFDLPAETQEVRESYLQSAQFIGRADELKTLLNELDRVRVPAAKPPTADPIGAAWLIGGESGVGKSRLVEEIRTRAMISGVLTLRGQATSEGGQPYMLWRDVVRRMVLIAPIPDDDAAILRGIVPDIEILLERPIPPQPEVEHQLAQRQLLLTVSRLFRAVLQKSPMVLIVEDLQWTVESLVLLREIAPLIYEWPLYVIGTYRDDERPNLPDELPNMRVMKLARLNENEIAKLSLSMLGSNGQRREVIDLLTRETEGNCFFLVEVVRALAQDAGRLSEIGRATLPSSVISGGIQRIINYRLGRIPAWARALLNIAAIYGRRIDMSILQAAAPDIDLDLWLTACVNAAVFDSADTHYRFAHDKLREGVLLSIDDDERAYLHRLTAQAIETAYPDNHAGYAAQLTYLWGIGGDPDKEATYAYIAAEEAHKVFDHRASKAHFLRALELDYPDRTANPRQTLADIYHGIGRACYGLSDYEQVYEWQNKALEIYRQIGDRQGEASALFKIGEAKMRQSDYPQAQQLTEEAQVIFEEIGDQKQVGYCMLSFGVIKVQTGQPREAREFYRRGYEIMLKHGDKLAQARALNNVAASTDMLGEYDEALRLYKETIVLRRELNDRAGIGYTLRNMGGLLTDEKRYAEALECLQEALQVLRTVGEKLAIANTLNGLGELYHSMSRYDEAKRTLLESLVMYQGIKDANGARFVCMGLAELLLDMGEHADARMYLKQVIEIVRNMKNIAAWKGDTLRLAAQFALIDRDYARVVELAACSRAHNEKLGRPTHRSIALIEQAQKHLMPQVFMEAIVRGESQSVEELFETL